MMKWVVKITDAEETEESELEALLYGPFDTVEVARAWIYTNAQPNQIYTLMTIREP